MSMIKQGRYLLFLLPQEIILKGEDAHLVMDIKREDGTKVPHLPLHTAALHRNVSPCFGPPDTKRRRQIKSPAYINQTVNSSEHKGNVAEDEVSTSGAVNSVCVASFYHCGHPGKASSK